jgi:hypothetical protein
MNIIHKPLKVEPENISLIPQQQRRQAITLPLKVAILVAVFTLLVSPQMIALKIRPPSNGNPGSKLKTARRILIMAR